MVTVTGYAVRERKDGTSFITLELSGSMEMVQSKTTGKFYATVRKCSIAATFDEEVAKLAVGTQMPGAIVRVESEPYEYVNKRTGEVMILSHTYAFRPAGAMELVGQTKVGELETA